MAGQICLNVFLVLSFTILYEVFSEHNTNCQDPIDMGSCSYDLQRYAFDPNSNDCVKFSYSGCGGNTNNFLTYGHCMDSCQVKVTTLWPEIFKETTESEVNEMEKPGYTTESVVDINLESTLGTEASSPAIDQTSSPTNPTTTNIFLSSTSSSFGLEPESLSTKGDRKFWIQTHYSGIAVENTLDPITLVPPLIFDRKICEIELQGNEPPVFRFELNQYENELFIIPLKHLDCETRQTYHFDLTFTDCSEEKLRSNPSSFFVVVYDINEHVPKFNQSQYEFSVASGEMFSHLFTAVDSDCGQTYSSICDYSFVVEDKHDSIPFRFSSLERGKLQSTKTLDFSERSRYAFHIAAKDCGNKVSNLVEVVINVEKPCDIGWKNIHDVSLESHHACLLPDATFEKCGYDCSSFSVETELMIEPGGCILESEESTIKRCPGEGDNLLEPGLSPEAKQVYTFYGTNTALEIVPIAEIMPETFGIASWLKHGIELVGEKDKETIICQTDSFNKNRHHFHLYVHSCNFGLTWRKPTTSKSDMRIETRTQFHWATNHFCDSNWHYVVLNVNTHSSVALFIDGVEQNLTTSKFSDPIVNVNESVSWAVGACWHGKEGKFVQHYEGKMASLNYMPGEHQKTLPCDRKCMEFLDYMTTHSEDVHVINERGTGKPKQKLSGLENTTAEEFEAMVRNVHYVNTALYENNFSRLIKVDSTAVCNKGDDVTKFHQSFNVSVNVSEAKNLIIRSQSREYLYSNLTLYRGVQLFPEISFGMKQETKADRRIELCRLFIYPPLKGINRNEGLSMSEIANLIMLKGHSGGEAIIRGPDSVKIFETALSKIIYYSSLSLENAVRNFSLRCVDDNQRKSNLITITVRTEIHTALRKNTTLSGVSNLFGKPLADSFIQDTKPVVSETKMDEFDRENPLHPGYLTQPSHARQAMQVEDLDGKSGSNAELKTFDLVIVGMLTTAGIMLIVFMFLFSIYRSRMKEFRFYEETTYDLANSCRGCSKTGVRTHMFNSDSSPDLLTITENPFPAINNDTKPTGGFLINPNFVKSHTLHDFSRSSDAHGFKSQANRSTFSGRHLSCSDFEEYYEDLALNSSEL